MSSSTRVQDDFLRRKLETYSAGILPSSTVEDIVDLVLDLVSLDSVRRLTRLLVQA